MSDPLRATLRALEPVAPGRADDEAAASLAARIPGLVSERRRARRRRRIRAAAAVLLLSAPATPLFLGAPQPEGAPDRRAIEVAARSRIASERMSTWLAPRRAASTPGQSFARAARRQLRRLAPTAD